MFGIDPGAVLDQNEVAGLERRFHRVEAQTQAIAIGAPQVPEDGEHFHLFLACGGSSGGNGTEQG